MDNQNSTQKRLLSGRANLTRITVNLTPPARAAISKICTGQGLNLTDAINRSLRIAAIIQEIAPDNQLRVIQADDTIMNVYLL